jgi:hypothetical protein
MTLNFLGAFDSYIPAFNGQVIQFSRNDKAWKLNKYSQLFPSKTELGLYYRIGVDFDVRVENDEQWVWKSGGKRPDWSSSAPKFDQVGYRCIRRSKGAGLDWRQIETADVKTMVINTRGIRNQMMTARTNRLWNGYLGGTVSNSFGVASGGLENPANWGSNTATAQSLNNNAGFWDQGSSEPMSPNFCAIKKSLDSVKSTINLLTNGAVNENDDSKLMLVLNPDAALRISQSPEIHAYIKESPYAMAQITGDKPGQNSQWGLPDKLYGWDLVVEDAAIVTQNQNAADAIGSEASTVGGSTAPRRYIKQFNTACVLSRVGGLDGENGAPSFSTVQTYYVGKELETKTFDEPKHELTEVYVEENLVHVLAAPASGWLITNLFA